MMPLLLMVTLAGVGLALQVFNQLIWQLSAILPYGLVGPASVLTVVTVLSVLVLAVVLLIRRL